MSILELPWKREAMDADETGRVITVTCVLSCRSKDKCCDFQKRTEPVMNQSYEYVPSAPQSAIVVQKLLILKARQSVSLSHLLDMFLH